MQDSPATVADLKTDLACLGGVLRDLDAAPIDRLNAANALLARFTDVTGLATLQDSRDESENFAETDLGHGLALSPFDAALCMHDYTRTYSFAEGLRRAILSAQARYPGERIRVLYAGTGPFAPLAALQIPHFTAKEVGFTLIDIHALSGRASRHLFEALEATGFVDAWVTGDATAWVPEPAQTYHVIVAEVMQRALGKEPQVEVTRHLSQFLEPRGHFVPERISLELRLFDPADMFSNTGNGHIEIRNDCPGVSLGTVFELTVESAGGMVAQNGVIPLPKVTVPDMEGRRVPLNIATRIVTFPGIEMADNESGLTTFETVNLANSLCGGEVLGLSYRLGQRPGLKVVPRGPIG